ncbi:MAG: phosphate ABC transporter permease subunit PstC [Chloroflexi bacterium]|nr:phosphate ABC transporter permease subunit PstC [Chloroflexota bacterium]
MGAITLAACALIIIVGYVLITRAWPLISTRTPGTLIFSDAWHPSQGEFGFWAFIMGSASVTLLAMLIAVPAALFSAIYLAEYSRARAVLKPLLDVLASIPSVIYGLWGVLFVVPLVRDHVSPWADRFLGDAIPFFANHNPTGYGLLSGSFVLAIMVFPIIVSVTDEVLRSVPQGMREASLALGATEWETTKLVVVRKALPGIIAATVLGFSRAFGETLAVLMVAGNVVQVPRSLFDAVYTLPALIANNYGEMMSIPMYDAALMAAALILLVVVLVFNIMARLILIHLSQESKA